MQLDMDAIATRQRLRKKSVFRFYAELNDFSPKALDGHELPYRFYGKPSIKDAIEAQGVPHTEVDLILVNGLPVGFEYSLQDDDRVAVYPPFETIDISPILKLREKPPRDVRFICDVHLGKLARWLRFLGFDTLYRNDYDDPTIVRIATRQNRVILTRDRLLLFRKAVIHGYLIRACDPHDQINEVLQRFKREGHAQAFARCLKCNGRIRSVRKAEIVQFLEPKTRRYYDRFYRCEQCMKIYWQGSHYNDMLSKLPKRGANE